MNEALTKILGYFDLQPGEIQTYLSLLRLGRGTAYQVAKTSGLKRPTVYVFVDRLTEKGLVTQREQQGRMIVTPVPPSQLIEIWKGRVKALETLKPELDALYSQSEYRPKVQVLEGEAGVDAVYQELPPLDSEGDEIILFGSVKAIRSGFEYLLPKWEQSFANKNNPIRELLNDESQNEEYLAQRTQLTNPHYQIRVMNGDVLGRTDTIIFRNKMAIFSLKQELFVIVIESEEIVKTYRALFEEAWRTAQVVQ